MKPPSTPSAVLVAAASLTALAIGVSLLARAEPPRDSSAVTQPSNTKVSPQMAASPSSSASWIDPGHAPRHANEASDAHGLNSLMGTVLGPDGLPVSGAQVSAVAGPDGDDPRPGALTTSDDEGGFLAQAPQGPGDYVARVQPPSHSNLAARLVQLRSGHPVLVVLSHGGRIEGRCRDAAGQPVGGIIKALGRDWSAQQDLDNQGRFTLSAVAPGRITLTAVPEQSMALAQSITVTVSAAATSHVRMTLPIGRTLTGRVTDGTGAAVPHAQVSLLHAESSLDEPLVAETSADGDFRLPGISAGEARLVVRGDAQSAGPFVIEVPPSEDPEAVTIRLSPHQVIEIHCMDPMGRTLGGVRCLAPSTATIAVSDRWGRATLGPLPAGEHVVSAGVAGAITVTTVISIQNGSGHKASGDALRHSPSPAVLADNQLDLVLAAAAEVRGTVLLPTGAPAAAAVVEIDDGQASPHRRRCDKAGRFTCRGVMPGQVRVAAHAPGTGMAATIAVATANNPVEVKLSLPAPGWLSGQVTDRRGVGLTGASVRVMGPWGELVTYGDADGRFALGGLGAGPVIVEARAPGHRPTLKEMVPLNSDVPVVLVRERQITGRVCLSSGEAVARFVVTATQPNLPEESNVFEDGHFELLLSGAEATLDILAEGLAPCTIRVPPDTESLRITLDSGDAVSGLVVDDHGEPLPGVAVLRGATRDEDLLSDMSFVRVLSMTDATGRFTVRGVPDSGLTVTLSHPDYAPRHVNLSATTKHQLQLSPGGRLRGRVTSADGTPLVGVGVVVEGPVIRRATTDASGVFAFRGLAAGTYEVIALQPVLSGVIEVEVSDAETTWVDVR